MIRIQGLFLVSQIFCLIYNIYKICIFLYSKFNFNDRLKKEFRISNYRIRFNLLPNPLQTMHSFLVGLAVLGYSPLVSSRISPLSGKHQYMLHQICIFLDKIQMLYLSSILLLVLLLSTSGPRAVQISTQSAQPIQCCSLISGIIATGI